MVTLSLDSSFLSDPFVLLKVSPCSALRRFNSLPRRGGSPAAIFAAGAVKGDPCHAVNCCPDAYASSVLSVDSVPAPSSDTGFCAVGGDGGSPMLIGYTPVV